MQSKQLTKFKLIKLCLDDLKFHECTPDLLRFVLVFLNFLKYDMPYFAKFMTFNVNPNVVYRRFYAITV